MTPHPSNVTLGAVVLGIGVAWAVIVGYVVHSQLPANALRLPGQQEVRADIRRVLPQGWAFFTRSAREPRLRIWRRSAGGWSPLPDADHGAARNLGGWDRGPRARANEAALVATSVPAGRWRSCAGDPAGCFDGVRPLSVTNSTTGALLCGTLGLSRREPLPWAWANTAHEAMPVTVTVVTVTC